MIRRMRRSLTLKWLCLFLLVAGTLAVLRTNSFLSEQFSSSSFLVQTFDQDRRLVQTANKTRYHGNNYDGDVFRRLQELIERSPGSNAGYNLTTPDLIDTSRGQARYIDKVLGGQSPGYFLELGPGDGETQSTTLWLERARKWTGMVVQPDKLLYRTLKHKHRNVDILNACVEGGITVWCGERPEAEIPRFPIDMVLQATGRKTIDLLVINTNGHEVDLLSSVPYDEVSIKCVTVEINGVFISTDEITAFMKSKGFETNSLLTNHVYQKSDFIFCQKK